jgi:hypothetical protein
MAPHYPLPLPVLICFVPLLGSAGFFAVASFCYWLGYLTTVLANHPLAQQCLADNTSACVLFGSIQLVGILAIWAVVAGSRG